MLAAAGIGRCIQYGDCVNVEHQRLALCAKNRTEGQKPAIIK